MDTKIITISIPADLLKEIDKAAKVNYSTRSGYIREALLLRLQGEVNIAAQKEQFLKELKQFDKRD